MLFICSPSEACSFVQSNGGGVSLGGDEVVGEMEEVEYCMRNEPIIGKKCKRKRKKHAFDKKKSSAALSYLNLTFLYSNAQKNFVLIDNFYNY